MSANWFWWMKNKKMVIKKIIGLFETFEVAKSDNSKNDIYSEFVLSMGIHREINEIIKQIGQKRWFKIRKKLDKLYPYQAYETAKYPNT